MSAEITSSPITYLHVLQANSIFGSEASRAAVKNFSVCTHRDVLYPEPQIAIRLTLCHYVINPKGALKRLLMGKKERKKAS